MIRMQVQLSEGQIEALRRSAAAEGRSLSDLVREAVDAFTASRHGASRAELKRRSLAAVGRFRSGTDDLSRDHDRHLADAFGQ